MNKKLAIVRGNDFFLEVPVRNIIFYRESSGEIVKATHPVDLERCEFLKVNIVDDCEERTSVPYVVQGSDLRIKICGCTVCGWYGIEVVYKLDSRKYRSYERKVFKIVPNNGSSFVSGEQYEGEQSYQVDTMWSLCSVNEIDLKKLIEMDSYRYTLLQIADMVELVSTYVHGNGNCSAVLADSGNNADGDHAHSEGQFTKASGSCAHSEGFLTTASGSSSHTGGQLCTATAPAAYAGGQASNTRGDASFVHGKGLNAKHVAEFALGILNDTNAEGGDGDDDYLIGSVGGGYSRDGEIVKKNLLEIWRNGSIYIQFLGNKVKIQDVFALFAKLIDVLKDKNVITSSDITLTSEDIEVIRNEDTIVGLEVKPWGMLPEDEIGDALQEEHIDYSGNSNDYYYNDGIGSWDDNTTRIGVIVDLGSQSRMTSVDENNHHYPIDEWNLSGDLYDLLKAIYDSGNYAVIKANLLFDGYISQPVGWNGSDTFYSTDYGDGRKIDIYIPKTKSSRYINVVNNEDYYYGALGSWDEG